MFSLCLYFFGWTNRRMNSHPEIPCQVQNASAAAEKSRILLSTDAYFLASSSHGGGKTRGPARHQANFFDPGL
jgi:hypothetical protein